MMRNIAYSDNTLLNDAVEGIRARLPDGWRLTPSKSPRQRASPAEVKLTVRRPDATSAVLLLQVKRGVSPRQAAEAAAKMTGAAREGRAAGVLLVSNYLSGLSRSRLRTAGVNYLDLTGNAWIALKRPGLLIETQGSDQNPSPPRRGVRSLKGTKAARIVRALCDMRQPTGVRQFARLSGSDPGYVSRIVDLLASEDLIRRGQGGGIAQADWQDLIRRWGLDYFLNRTNRPVACLAPRGLAAVTDRLRACRKPYALTGSSAVPEEALVAAGRLLAGYVDDPLEAADFLGARPAETGANVLLLEPFDRVVYDRVRTDDELV